MAPRSKPKESQRRKKREKQESHSVLSAGRKVVHRLSQLPKCWDHRHLLAHTTVKFFWILLPLFSYVKLQHTELLTILHTRHGLKSVLLLVDLLWFLTLLWLPLKPSEDNLRHTYPPYPMARKPFPTSQQCTMTLGFTSILLHCTELGYSIAFCLYLCLYCRVLRGDINKLLLSIIHRKLSITLEKR